MTTLQETDATYAAHSEQIGLVNANRAFVEGQSLHHVRRFLDLACGPGVVSEMLAQASPRAHIQGIDLDPDHIDLASQRFGDLGYEVRHGFDLTTELVNDRPVVTFAVGSADELPFPEASFDCITITNAIHLLPDKKKLVDAASRVLRPGGLFGFTSAFYAGTFPDGTHSFYHEWMRAAALRVMEIDKKLKAEGKPGVKRVRGTTRKAFQNRWLSPQEWTELLAESGMTTVDVHERVLHLDGRFFASIGAYRGLAETLLSGYPIEVACEALGSTAEPTMSALNITSVPRNWLEVWAQKA